MIGISFSLAHYVTFTVDKKLYAEKPSNSNSTNVIARDGRVSIEDRIQRPEMNHADYADGKRHAAETRCGVLYTPKGCPTLALNNQMGKNA